MIPKRKTSAKRFSRAMRAINAWLKRARHWPLEVQAWLLGAKLRGHYQYYGVRRNSQGITRFQYAVGRSWHRWLSRRSQRGHLTWERFSRILKKYPLPPARLPPRPTLLRLANL